MTCTVEIIRKNEQVTSTWQGGTTTQLAIYPKASDYKARNFKWRLSSARVDIEESTFTSLPGIWRHIMLLDGEMTLRHEGHHSMLLRPLEQDSFSGSWATTSYGTARDFNLMLSEGNKGGLEGIKLESNSTIAFELNTPQDGFTSAVDAFYCISGELKVALNENMEYSVQQGDLMIVYCTSDITSSEAVIRCTSQGGARMVRAGILYNG